MTKKDYELIANTLRRRYEGQVGVRKDEVRAIITLLAYELACENPKFSQDKFWEACGTGDPIYATQHVYSVKSPFKD